MRYSSRYFVKVRKPMRWNR